MKAVPGRTGAIFEKQRVRLRPVSPPGPPAARTARTLRTPRNPVKSLFVRSEDGEGVVEVSKQVVEILDADGNSYQSVGLPDLLPFLPGHGGVGHGGGV